MIYTFEAGMQQSSQYKILGQNIYTMKSEKKKEEVSERANKLDPNNNKNLQEKPIVKRRGKKVHDDGFEHRTSSETSA